MTAKRVKSDLDGRTHALRNMTALRRLLLS